MTPQIDKLGAAVSAVHAASFPDEDWQIAAYGDCTSLLGDSQERAFEEAAARFGFTLESLYASVVERTSARFAYENLGF